MKNIEKIIIILVILLILVTIVLINIIKTILPNYEIDPEDDVPQDMRVELKTSIHQESDDFKFCGIDQFINQFLEYINDKNEKAIYALVDEESKNEYKIEDIVKNITDKGIINRFYSSELYKRESRENVIYYLSGKLEITNDQDKNEVYDKNFEICIDNNNNTASVKILTDAVYQTEITDMSEEIKEKEISLNEYNQYTEPMFSNKQLIQKYLENYIFKLKYEPEQAFSLLDGEYKEKKFNNDIKKFKEYINENKDILFNIQVYDFEKEITDENIEFVIKSSSGNIYTIKRKSFMDYTIILDNNTN